MSVSPPPRAVSAGPALFGWIGPTKVVPPSSDRHTGLAVVREPPSELGALTQIVCGFPDVPCVPGGATAMLGSPKPADVGSITGGAKEAVVDPRVTDGTVFAGGGALRLNPDGYCTAS